LIDCSASGGAEMKPDARAGKKEGGWGEGIFARPRFSAAAEFRSSPYEMRRLEKRWRVCSARSCAHNRQNSLVKIKEKMYSNNTITI